MPQADKREKCLEKLLPCSGYPDPEMNETINSTECKSAEDLDRYLDVVSRLLYYPEREKKRAVDECSPKLCTTIKYTLTPVNTKPFLGYKLNQKYNKFIDGDNSVNFGENDKIPYRLVIRLGGMSTTVREDYSYKFNEILGEIGGIWGLFLGASLLGMIETAFSSGGFIVKKIIKRNPGHPKSGLDHC